MAKKIIKAQMKQRRDTRANWAATNPVLLDGELGIVSDDPNLYKVGDGTTAWNNLPFRGFDGTLVHETGTSDTSVMSQKAVTEALTDLEQELKDKVDNLPKGDVFDSKGRYPDLSVGFADDLVGRGESVPAEFSFRASGGKSIKDGTAWIKRLKGNSVVWNNIAEWRGVGSAKDGITVTYDNGYIHVQGVAENTAISFYSVMYDDISKSGIFIKNHRYMVSDEGDKFYLSIFGDVSITGPNVITEKTGESVRLTISAKNLTIGEEINETFPIRVVDLTQMFGAGDEPTTIEEFYARKPIVEDEYAYNEGEVIHMTAESIKSVGDNAWDEEWKRGYYMGKEYISVATNQICSANPIPCLPNEAYCVSVTGKTSFPNTIKFTFLDAQGDSIGEVKITNTDQKITTPINATSFLVSFGVDYGDTYKNDILISLYHSGWKAQKDDQYQPYWQDTLPLPIIRKYFPDGMKSAGSAHDEIRYNKATQKWEAVKRIGEVDMGTMDWILTSQMYFRALLPSDSIAPTNTDYNGFICAKYERVDFNLIYSQQVAFPCFGIPANNPVCCVVDSSYTDAASFKTAMQGVILYYELAEPIVTELDEADQNFRYYYQVADFGTEQSQSSVPSAAFSADIIYQFNAVDMIREHEIEIAELQSIITEQQSVIATMQAQLASLTNKE